MSGENPLSERELDVLRLVAEGLTNREIAQKLSISHNTVKVHLSNIFEKIGVASRTEATVYAIEHRIVGVPGGEAAAAPAQPGLRELIRQFRWVWLAMLVLLVLIGLTFTTNLLTREATPETIATVDVSERWQELAPMPEPRTGMAAVAYGGDIYVIGGEGPEGVSGKGFRYIPETDEWLAIAEKPTPVTNAQAVEIGEKIYIPGGIKSDNQLTNILEIYDPILDIWEEGGRLPVEIGDYSLADFEGSVYLFGGWDGNKTLNSVWIYDPSSENWHNGIPMDTPRRDAEAVALSDQIVILGGRNDDGILNSARSYFPSREVPWGAFPGFPEKRYSFGAASINDSIYIVGGRGIQDFENLPAYQYISGKWHTLPINIIQNEVDVLLVPIGSSVYLMAFDKSVDITSLWHYQAYYYEIYLPIVE